MGPSHQWDMHRHSLFLLTLLWPSEDNISPKHLLFRRRATWARAWVEVENRAHRPGLQGPRGVSTPLHLRLSLQSYGYSGHFSTLSLWERVLFDSGASHSFVAASCVKYLGLNVETLEKLLYVNSPLWTRVSVDQICRDCELEISGILLTMDLRVMDMSEFDVILGMVLVLRFRGISMTLYPEPCTTLSGSGS